MFVVPYVGVDKSQVNDGYRQGIASEVVVRGGKIHVCF